MPGPRKRKKGFGRPPPATPKCSEELQAGLQNEEAAPVPLSQDPAERYRQLLAVLPAAMYSCDADGCLTYYNDQAAQAWGWSPVLGPGGPRFCGAHRLYRLDGSPLPHDQTPMANALREGKSVRNTEVVMERPDGTRVIASVNIDPLRDPDGRISGAINVFTDITEKKRTEQALQQTSQRLQTMINSITDGLLVLDREWRYVYFSERAARIIGVRGEEMVGRVVWDVFPGARDTRFYEYFHRAMETGQAQHFQEFYPEPLNQWLECRCYPGTDGLTVYFQDITERKEAEDQLRRNHDTFYHLIQNNPFGVYVVDADFRLRQASAGSRKVFSTVNPLIGRDFAEVLRAIWAEPFATEAIDRFRHTLQTGEPYVSPGTIERRQDTEEMEAYDWRIERIILPDGRYGVVCYFYDLSERQRWETALSESEHFYRQTLESIPGMVFTTRPDGYCDYQSQQWVEYTGVPLREHLGAGWNKLLHPDDQARAYAIWQVAVEDRGRYDLEYRVRRHDGVYEWFKVIGQPIRDPEGRIVRWFGVAMNIQDLKEAEEALRRSEERLRLAKTAGQIGIHDFNPVTGELLWDERVRELWQIGPNDPVNYDVFIQGLHPEDRAATNEAVRRALDPAGDGYFYVEYRLQRDSRPRWIAATGHTTFQDGKAVRFVGTVQDITQQKEFRAELERLVAERTAKLHEMVGELEHFSYSITHDMRAPLRAMRGFAEAVNELSEGSPQSEVKTFLRHIITSAERMDLLITDALNYSTAVRQDLRLGPVDVGRLLEGMLDTYPEFLANRACIRLEGELPRVIGNEAGLTQCFSNLIGNALKFVAPGETPRVQVRAEALTVSEPGSGNGSSGWVRLWVEDKGIGISPLMMPRVFQMFSRGSRQYEGTGIGLALVRKVVERMGGKVGVESEQGKGSRFWVELKTADPSSPASAP